MSQIRSAQWMGPGRTGGLFCTPGFWAHVGGAHVTCAHGGTMCPQAAHGPPWAHTKHGPPSGLDRRTWCPMCVHANCVRIRESYGGPWGRCGSGRQMRDFSEYCVVSNPLLTVTRTCPSDPHASFSDPHTIFGSAHNLRVRTWAPCAPIEPRWAPMFCARPWGYHVRPGRTWYPHGPPDVHPPVRPETPCAERAPGV
jgi:hypothetical protein